MNKDVPLSRTRLRIISLGVIFLSIIFIIKLFSLQILHGEDFTDKADRQYISSGSVFDRGSIYFYTKDEEKVSAGTLSVGYKLVIVPKDITDAESLFTTLSEYVELDHDDFIMRANKKADTYEEIVEQLKKEKVDEIEALALPGVKFFKHKWRSYPGDELAAHVIGFLGYDGDDLVGRYGIERYYADTLKRSETDLYVNFFAEVFANLGSVLGKEGEKEGDVVLTIEPQVQTHLEATLVGIQDKWSADAVGGIIINPQNGEIYAMGYTPTFNPNKYGEVENVSLFTNPNVQSVFEMGSIIKPLIMAAGIDTGAVSASTSYFDKGSVIVKDKTIYNFDKKGRGQVTMQDVLNQSLNTGMVYVQQHMKKSDLKKYLESYGLRDKTGIDLPGELASLSSNLDTNGDVEYANLSFGQGIALTPIATARALSTLGNGGYMIQPHVVKKIEYTNSFNENIEYEKGEQVISQETSDEITRMLVEVVDSTLLGGKAKLDYYSIAAKTGTAQIPQPTGGYYGDRNLHSFFGYFPAYDPQFLVFFYTLYPKGARYASETLAPPFMDIAKFLIHYYDVVPDRAPSTITP